MVQLVGRRLLDWPYARIKTAVVVFFFKSQPLYKNNLKNQHTPDTNCLQRFSTVID